MSSHLGHPRHEDTGSDTKSSRAPMSTAARERLAGMVAGRAKDPEFLRKVEAVRSRLGAGTNP